MDESVGLNESGRFSAFSISAFSIIEGSSLIIVEVNQDQTIARKIPG